MALFAKKDEKKKAEPAKQEGSGAPIALDLMHVLRNPRITEKASDLSAVSVYTFDVDTDATKALIARAVKALYNVTPRKVAVVTVPSKMRRSARTGRAGVKKGGKKAYVYLKKGETITIA